jgi:hypothetical protein
MLSSTAGIAQFRTRFIRRQPVTWQKASATASLDTRNRQERIKLAAGL